MLENIQYVTNQQGQRVGVLMDLQSYERMVEGLGDPELIHGLSNEELVALANTKLAGGEQEKLKLLLNAQRTQNLTEAEEKELDVLIEQIDYLNIIKARALYTLQQANENNGS